MTRRNPFEELEQLFERMSRQVETGDWSAFTGESVSIDLIDAGHSYEIAADLPGFEREDIDITLSGDRLEITASSESDVEETDVRYLRRERQRRSVSRSVRIPESVDEDSATATYTNGVLSVSLPKIEPSDEGRQIDIE